MKKMHKSMHAENMIRELMPKKCFKKIMQPMVLVWPWVAHPPPMAVATASRKSSLRPAAWREVAKLYVWSARARRAASSVSKWAWSGSSRNSQPSHRRRTREAPYQVGWGGGRPGGGFGPISLG